MSVKLGLSHSEKEIEDVWKEGAEEKIWTQEGESGGWLEKTA